MLIVKDENIAENLVSAAEGHFRVLACGFLFGVSFLFDPVLEILLSCAWLDGRHREPLCHKPPG